MKIPEQSLMTLPVSPENRPAQSRCICYRDVGARQCFDLRYRRDYIFGENCGTEEICECPCHDEEDEAHDEDSYFGIRP